MFYILYTVQELFSSMDLDQNGTITLLELYRFIVKVYKLENYDHTKIEWADVREIFKQLDRHSNSHIYSQAVWKSFEC